VHDAGSSRQGPSAQPAFASLGFAPLAPRFRHSRTGSSSPIATRGTMLTRPNRLGLVGCLSHWQWQQCKSVMPDPWAGFVLRCSSGKWPPQDYITLPAAMSTGLQSIASCDARGPPRCYRRRKSCAVAANQDGVGVSIAAMADILLFVHYLLAITSENTVNRHEWPALGVFFDTVAEGRPPPCPRTF
jgi:hypothetical protein